MTSDLAAFAAEIGPAGEVACAGGMTQWETGGAPAPAVRTVRAPRGVVSHEPAEMIVRVGAATTLSELQDTLADAGQQVAIESDLPAQATVGGLLSVGHGGLRRLGWGPVRDTVLEVSAVNSLGEVIRAGAPLVKNVTGFDLCRLLVGSLGTLALLGEVVLRCRPLPEAEEWWVGEGADPFALADRLYQPLAVLWDGNRTWVGLAGYAVDIRSQVEGVLGADFVRIEGPPAPAGTIRRSLRPSALRDLPGRSGSGSWLAEVGVGVVHCDEVTAAALLRPPGAGHSQGIPEPVVRLHREIKHRFDPTGRLNPGRSPLPVAS